MESEQLQSYLERRGARGERALKALAEVGVALKAFTENPIGKQILDDDIGRFEDLLIKLASGHIEEGDMPELRYLYRRLEKIASLVQAKIRLHEEINKGE